MNIWDKIGVSIAVVAVLVFVGWNYASAGNFGKPAEAAGLPILSKSVFVSSMGDDNNNGLTQDSPVRTLTKAINLRPFARPGILMVNVIGPNYELIDPDIVLGNGGIVVQPGVTMVVLTTLKGTGGGGMGPRVDKARIFTNNQFGANPLIISSPGIPLTITQLWFDGVCSIIGTKSGTPGKVTFSSNVVDEGNDWTHEGLMPGEQWRTLAAVEGDAVVVSGNELRFDSQRKGGVIYGFAVIGRNQGVKLVDNDIIFPIAKDTTGQDVGIFVLDSYGKSIISGTEFETMEGGQGFGKNPSNIGIITQSPETLTVTNNLFVGFDGMGMVATPSALGRLSGDMRIVKNESR